MFHFSNNYQNYYNPTYPSWMSSSSSSVPPSDLDIWRKVIGSSKTSDSCPVCFTNTIYQNGGNWRKAHYIALDKGGADVLPNCTPCCRTCFSNLSGMGVYHYQQNKGMMTSQQKAEVEQKKKAEIIAITGGIMPSAGTGTTLGTGPEYSSACVYHLGRNNYCRRRSAHASTSYCQSHVNVNEMPMEIDLQPLRPSNSAAQQSGGGTNFKFGGSQQQQRMPGFTFGGGGAMTQQQQGGGFNLSQGKPIFNFAR